MAHAVQTVTVNRPILRSVTRRAGADERHGPGTPDGLRVV
jgi:hypothetical protein